MEAQTADTCILIKNQNDCCYICLSLDKIPTKLYKVPIA